ncbi:3-oxoacyl-[acyl-carrier-protein] synthase-1 [Atopomonas hussainii]|uniref:3-oxoacyl-[acyl-carrier-protein] synthase-1 n=1 Tax=Atopomonas hussainii TaxID=1429083 RepID=A0A1H7HRB2_9GAMM|nr:beta-ketoacyl-ACP synthase [Atopomonas hussainii]SEK52799.1 3-oxoacyl-[acyl-carrier-protein] synthase-1 [Atopomonas hussainii]
MNTYLNALGLISPLGNDLASTAQALFSGRSGLQKQAGWIPEQSIPVGAVNTPLAALPDALHAYENRCNRLLYAALAPLAAELDQALTRYGRARVGLVIGTSTAGILEGGQAVREGHAAAHYGRQELTSATRWLEQYLGLQGPVILISTACTSGARALLTAKRLLHSDLCDVVLCGGADSLCHLTLNGFNALEAIAAEPCQPLSANRQGINIGEAAALFLLSKEPSPIRLLGAAASSDAHHMSAPDPSGQGALRAMQGALKDAQLSASDIGYLNLHGTATVHNDAMESLAAHQLFAEHVPCSSTKPLTGHTLGAAGALEAAFCWLTLHPDYNPERRLPLHCWDGQADPKLPRLALADSNARLAKPYAMSNSFAFGGNNACVILGAST